MPDDKDAKCPHCGVKMLKWMPPEGASWDRVGQYVCFNNECSYYVKGWEWMKEKYSHTVSYRHRYDPNTGEKGPLPVWSEDAMREGIIKE
ncbi:ogr/Delta-like zinc finger family protein [Elusimicrobiota bacterium]